MSHVSCLNRYTRTSCNKNKLDGLPQELCEYNSMLYVLGDVLVHPITEINSTYQANDIPSSEEDVLYQRGASFSAELDVNNNNTTLFDAKILPNSGITKNGKAAVADDNSKSDYDDDGGKKSLRLFLGFFFPCFQRKCLLYGCVLVSLAHLPHTSQSITIFLDLINYGLNN